MEKIKTKAVKTVKDILRELNGEPEEQFTPSSKISSFYFNSEKCKGVIEKDLREQKNKDVLNDFRSLTRTRQRSKMIDLLEGDITRLSPRQLREAIVLFNSTACLSVLAI